METKELKGLKYQALYQIWFIFEKTINLINMRLIRDLWCAREDLMGKITFLKKLFGVEIVWD